jgi:hypothetical protein
MLFALRAMSDRTGFYSSSKVLGWSDRDHRFGPERLPSPIGQQLHDPDTSRQGFALPVPSVSICSSGRMGVSERITALPAGQLYHSFAQTFLSTLAGTAGASALGSRAIRDRHHYHDLQVADGDKGLRHTQGGVTFGLSPGVAFLIVQTPFQRNGCCHLACCR